MNLIGQNLGQYRIVESIGAGGMATVYKAFQARLERHVAVKVLPAQHALTPGFKERFNREAKAVAQLSHPNILPIYDFGIDQDVSYFVMKYVPGKTLRDVMKTPITLPKICDYVDQIAGALDHAHQKGILHRDIKPVNILMEEDWLLLADFGLAKIVEGTEALTATGSSMGTPAYVSPEQATGNPVDHHTDIYSLGIVLYEMATGKVPYSGETPMGVMFKHVYEPLPMPRHVKPDLPEAVETVILKALAKNPDDRHNSAGQLAKALHQAVELGLTDVSSKTVVSTPPAPTASDAEKTLASQPGVTLKDKARQPATGAAGRPPWLWIGLTVLALVVAVGGAVALLSGSQSQEPTPAGLLMAEESSGEEAGSALAQLTAQPEETDPTATAASVAAAPPTPLDTPPPAPTNTRQLPAPTATAAPAAAASEAEPTDDSAIRSFADVPRLSASLVLGRGPINDLAMSPNNDQLAVAGSGGMWLYDPKTLELTDRLEAANSNILAVAWSPDGSRVAGGGSNGLIYVWTLEDDAAAPQTLSGHTAEVVSVAWSPNGARLASGSGGASASTVRIWDVDSGQEQITLTGHLYVPYDVAWSPDGTQVASVSRDKSLRIWDVASGGQLQRLESHLDEVNSVDWSPDGQKLVTASSDLTIRVWDTERWQEENILTGHEQDILDVDISPDETRLASGSVDGTVRIWDLTSGELLHTLAGHTQPGVIAAWADGGSHLISGGLDGALRLWDANSGEELAQATPHTSFLQAVAWSPDDSRIAAAGFDGKVHIWEVAGQQEVQTLTLPGEILLSLTWSPDGQQMAAGTVQGTVALWAVGSGELEQTLSGHSDQVTAVAWSPAGAQLASASVDGAVRLWDAASGAQLRELTGHAGSVNQVVWSPDGSQLASASDDTSVIIWDPTNGDALRQLEASGGADNFQYYYKGRGPAWLDSLDWSPDGRRLATGSRDFVARLWDAASGAQLRILEGAAGPVLNVAWAADSRRLAVTGIEGNDNIVVWNAIPDEPLYFLPDSSDTIYSLDWAAAGSQLAAAGSDGVVRIWNVPEE